VEGKEVPQEWQLQVGLMRHFFKLAQQNKARA
jgi:hypothetical protein